MRGYYLNLGVALFGVAAAIGHYSHGDTGAALFSGFVAALNVVAAWFGYRTEK